MWTHVAKHLPLFRAESPCAGWPHHPCSRWAMQWKRTWFWAVQLDTPFPRCARFKGKGMVDVSVDAVLPPTGPPPSPGCIPTPSLWENNCSWDTVWGKLCLYQAGRLVLHIWPKYQSPATLKGREEAIWALAKTTCVLAREDNHGDTGKSSIIFHATSPPSHCLCGEKFPWLLCRWCYIQPKHLLPLPIQVPIV